MGWASSPDTEHPGARQKAGRRVVPVIVVAGCIVALVGAATAALFISPSTSEPARADAIVLLGGDFGDRLPVALRLIDRDLAPVLLHVGGHDSQDVLKLCRAERLINAEVVCVVPMPDTTRKGAETAAQLARSRGWESLMVVTSKYHVARAGMWFRRCYGGKVALIGTEPESIRKVWQEQVLHEWGGLIEGVVHRGC